MARDQIAQALNKQGEKRSTIKLTNSLFVKSRIIFLQPRPQGFSLKKSPGDEVDFSSISGTQ